MTERVVYVEHTERAAYGGSSLCDYYMKTIPELCVKEAEGGFKLLYASKRYRMVYVTDHESEIIRWNRVKALRQAKVYLPMGAFVVLTAR